MSLQHAPTISDTVSSGPPNENPGCNCPFPKAGRPEMKTQVQARAEGLMKVELVLGILSFWLRTLVVSEGGPRIAGNRAVAGAGMQAAATFNPGCCLATKNARDTVDSAEGMFMCWSLWMHEKICIHDASKADLPTRFWSCGSRLVLARRQNCFFSSAYVVAPWQGRGISKYAGLVGGWLCK